MSLDAFLPVALALGICLIPVWLLRRPGAGRAQDYFVASQDTRPEVVRNSSIAYALRLAAIGPLFAWGASGDFWPAIIGAAFLGLGIYLIYVVRQPLLEFVDGALAGDRSITVHEFVAQEHGNDPRVRLLAASFTAFALLGLLVVEALAVAALLEPLLSGSASVVYLIVFGALALTALQAVPAGHPGVMHSAQLQLGMLYLGLFGSAVLLLYLHVSALAPVPPHGRLAVAVVAVCCVLMLYYRRSKYVDTAPIPDTASGARLLSRFAKILNPCLSILAVLIVVVAFMALYAAGLPVLIRDGADALQAGTRVPGVGLVAVGLLGLVYPIVDVTNWQRLAAARKDSSGVEPGRRAAVLRGLLGTYAVESAVVWLLMCMLGAIAVTAIETPDGGHSLQAFVAQLVSERNEVNAIVLPLFLICVLAIALSTMSALFSATLCTLRYDLVAALWPELAPGTAQAAKEAAALRSTLLAALALAAAFCVADASLRIGFTGGTFPALLVALCCAQLSLAPLVLGPIVGRMRGGSGTVRPGWALAILGLGTASGIAAVAVHLSTGAEEWLWAAVPVCLGSGLVLFSVARAASRRAA